MQNFLVSEFIFIVSSLLLLFGRFIFYDSSVLIILGFHYLTFSLIIIYSDINLFFSCIDIPPKVPVKLGSCPSDKPYLIDIGDEYCYHYPMLMSERILSWDTTSRYCLLHGELKFLY